jgi:polyvinyl alcohol dehydrogenase (cytochrome)
MSFERSRRRVFLKRSAALAATCTLYGAAPALAQTNTPDGAAIYARHCAACHDQVSPSVPSRVALTQMSPERILRTLDFGLMMAVAYALPRDEREAVARFIGSGTDVRSLPATALCTAQRGIMSGSEQASWTAWSPAPDNARFQSRAGLRVRDVPRLKLKWAFGFAGDVTAFAAPTVWRDTLFVGSAGGVVQALDAATGCIHWQFQASGPVRGAPTVATTRADERVLLFSDQNGSVYALDARTGGLRWQTRVEQHEATRLTGSFAVHEGVAFVPAASWEETRSIDPEYPCCTFRGSITAVRIDDGSVVWKTHLVDDPVRTGTTPLGTPTFGPSGAGVWSAPTVDVARGLLYVTTGDNYSHPATPLSDAVVALALGTGAIVWSQQTLPNDVYNSACGSVGPNCPEDAGPDYDFGSSAILVRLRGGRDLLVAGQKSGVVYALDAADRGRILWQTRVGRGSTNGGVQWGMASDGRKVYAAVSDIVRPPGGVAGVGSLGNAALDPVQGGGLTALDLTTGTKAWFAPSTACQAERLGCSPAQPGAVTAMPGVVFSGAIDGHLRAFATADGSLLWDFDTVREYETVNDVKARGGSLDGAGPVIVGGRVFVNSGYPRFGGMPGNVLLAFGADD